MRILPFLPACLMLAISPMAQANLISSTITLPADYPDWSLTPAFTLFDPSLGTLNSVDVNISSSFSGSVSMQNVSAVAGNYTAYGQATLVVSFIDGSPVDTVSLLATPVAQYLTAYDGTVGPGSSGYFSASGLTASASMDDVFTDPTSLSYFIGSGTSTLGVAANDQSFLIGPGQVAGGVTDTIAATLVLTMDYTPTSSGNSNPPILQSSDPTVPEPAALGVFAVGLATLAGLRRWRRNLSL